MPNKLFEVLLSLVIIAIVAIIIFLFIPSPKPRLEVDFLDVDQGDAVLIKTPFNQNILIDGGPDKTILYELGKNLPWWEHTIDLMILTHPHADHLNGQIEIMKRYKVKKVLYSGIIHNTSNYISWLKLIKNKDIPLAIIDKKQTINLGNDCGLKILYPDFSLLGKKTDSLNNTSVVSRLDCQGSKFLFTGDAEAAVEQKLIAGSEDLSADVLKIAHHGSADATSQEFLEAVKPKIAIIQAGKNNQFNHPNPQTLKTLEQAGVVFFRTDKDGTIKLINSSEGIIKL